MATPTFRSASNKQTAGATSLAVTKPTGTASGDVLYATVTTFTNLTGLASSGWSQISTSFTGGGMNAMWLRKVAGGSEPASYTFSWTTSQAVNISLYAWQNVDNSTPEDALSQSSGNSGTITINSVTPSVSGGIQLGLMTNVNGPYNAAPSGWTQDNTDGGQSNGEDHRNATLTSGTPSGSGSQTIPVGGGWACLAIALKPTGSTPVTASGSTLALMGVG